MSNHLDISERDILSVTEGDDLIEGEDKLKRILAHVGLVDLARAVLVEHLGEEAKSLQVLHDVRLFVCQYEQVQRLDRLVDVPHLSCLDCVMLLLCACEQMEWPRYSTTAKECGRLE